MPRNTYTFREVDEDDLPMIASWLEQAHWREWWGEPDEAIAEIGGAIGDIAVEPLIVELDGEPIAYLQSYDPHLEDDHPFQDQPMGTLGLDLSIGPAELIGKGHGSAILRQFNAALFDEGCPRIIIDPHPDNARAIRAFEKAGFRQIDNYISIYGPAFLMALDAPEEN